MVSLRTAHPGVMQWDVLALQPDWAGYAAVAGGALTPHYGVSLKYTLEFIKNVRYSLSTASLY